MRAMLRALLSTLFSGWSQNQGCWLSDTNTQKSHAWDMLTFQYKLHCMFIQHKTNEGI